MIRKLKISVIFMATIGMLVFLGTYISILIAQHRARLLYQQVQNNGRRYVYETYYGPLNAVYYVEDQSDTAALIRYYEKTANRDSDAYLNFSIKSMPIGMHQPVYIYKELGSNSKVIELIDFDVKCWGYIKGFVYKPTAHLRPPPDSLIKEEEAFIIAHNNDKEATKMNKFVRIAYAWYCKEE